MTTEIPQSKTRLAERELSAAPRPVARERAGYVLFVAAVLVVCWPTVAELIRQWSQSSSFRHGFAVAPIALALALRVRSGVPARRSRLALAPLYASIALWIAGRASNANLIEEVALVLILTSGVGVFFGIDAVRQRSFPLAFLFFMVPAGVSLYPALQAIAATLASLLLSTAAIAHERAGLVISTSAGGFKIAESCAGLNFLLAALMISTLFAHLKSLDWRRSALFVVAAAVIALAANAVRVFAVIAIATWSEGTIEIAADHLAFSLAVYGLFVVLLVSIGDRISSLPPKSSPGCHEIRRTSLHGFGAMRPARQS